MVFQRSTRIVKARPRNEGEAAVVGQRAVVVHRVGIRHSPRQAGVSGLRVGAAAVVGQRGAMFVGQRADVVQTGGGGYVQRAVVVQIFIDVH